MESTEKILAYLSNEMDEGQKVAFEKELHEDPALRQELSFYQELNLAGEIFGEGGVMDQLEDTWKKQQLPSKQIREVKLKNQHESVSFFSTYGRYAAAVILLILAGGVWFIQDQWRSSGNEDELKLYAALKIKAEQQYQNSRIESFDTDLKFGRKRGGGEPTKKAHPRLDTLVSAQQPVSFQWKVTTPDKALLLEVLTKENQNKPVRIPLPANTTNYLHRLTPGLYYWRLSTMNANVPEKVVKIGRFYVVDIKDNQ
ncbi:hypothetical protein BKI52_40205 [marine bacterium AO1-C]|nr:hypothetical protein BKI52_40205 [marine bacterium AO1-C]